MSGLRPVLGRFRDKILHRLGLPSVDLLLSLRSEMLDELMRILTRMEDQSRRQLLLLHELQSDAERERPPAVVAHRVFSQFGEDGILRGLLDQLNLETKAFVEIGTENYQEANTRLLAERGGWRGLLIDSSTEAIEQVRQSHVFWRNDLTAISAFVEPDNVNELLSQHGFTGEISLLSIDIDGMDYWVWQALSVVQPAIVVCEYNSLFGANTAVTVPYSPGFSRCDRHWSCLYFGASLGALTLLAATKQYELVAVEPAGVNAFFVHRSIIDRLDPSFHLDAFQLSTVRESRDAKGELTFVGGNDRIALIADQMVLDVASGEEIRIGDLDITY